ncbi:MAG: LysM peptidoglycan-binding domain-containing protein [Chloroflexota bacterium]
MNKPPHSSTSSVINAYRKRRQRRNPNIIYIIAGVLVLIGIIMLIVWLSGPDKPIGAMFATDTPTPTTTFTPTSTNTPTETPTITSTATITVTPTFSQPFNYTVQEGDYLQLIVDKFGLGTDGIALILYLNPYGGINETTGFPIGVDPATLNIIPGQIITLPNPGMPLPSATPLPTGMAPGTEIDYTVQSGDTLAGIAALFNTTEDAIIEANELEDANAIFAGQVLIVPVNLVTPTATRPPTSTPATPGAGTSLPSPTWTPIN